MSQQKPRIGVILGTTRPSRWGHKPADWIAKKINDDGRMTAEILDLAEFDLPMFDEVASNRWAPSQDPAAVKWQQTLDGYDGFVFVTAEYNHSISGALKNALDQAFNEWGRKPAAIVGYGGVGAARAVEHLRAIAVELRMVNVSSAVHISGGELMKVHPMGGNADGEISEIEDVLMPSATAMLDELTWWSEVLNAARDRDAERAAA